MTNEPDKTFLVFDVFSFVTLCFGFDTPFPPSSSIFDY